MKQLPTAAEEGALALGAPLSPTALQLKTKLSLEQRSPLLQWEW